MLSGDRNSLMRAVVQFGEWKQPQEITALAKEAIETENIGGMEVIGSYLALSSRRDILYELIDHATETGNSNSRELLASIAGGQHNGPRAVSHDEPDEEQ